jgi:uncharacterized protein (DUF1015 family)
MEPGDDEADNRYIRAARFLKNWRSEGVLFQEADPAVYVYHQEFTWSGRRYTRRGFMARMRISPFGQGLVFPHEQTLSAPKLDRLMLTVVTKAALSPIFGLYPDASLEADGLLDGATAGRTPLEATDPWGAMHRLWPVSDIDVIADLTAIIGPKPVFIADGHHRYETACKYREEIYDSGFLAKDHPANYTLMMFVAMEDPGLVVLPTHRLFLDLPSMTSKELTRRLGDLFTTRPAGWGPDEAPTVWEDVETSGDQGTLALFTRQDQHWTIVQLTPAGGAKLAAVAEDHSPEWRELGVSVLHRLIVETILDRSGQTPTKYVHKIEEVTAGLRSGQYPLAALVMPATVSHVRTISLQGDRMPAKSTYFYPKLLSGLVVNPLE